MAKFNVSFYALPLLLSVKRRSVCTIFQVFGIAKLSTVCEVDASTIVPLQASRPYWISEAEIDLWAAIAMCVAL